MSSKDIKNGFISGWEYNLILDRDPILSSRASGLPAKALWQCGSIFWMFETVECPLRAYEGDLSALKNLGWATGAIFADLKEMEALCPIDLKEALSPTERDKFVKNHDKIRNSISESQLRNDIVAGRVERLDATKLCLFESLMRSRNCLPVVSPNSVKHWYGNQETIEPMHGVFAEITGPIESSLPILTYLIDPPATLVSQEVLSRQQAEEERSQKHLIPDLLLGHLPQAEYESLVRTGDMSVYEPLNKMMAECWSYRKPLLLELRRSAKRNLWKHLHKDWLPEIFDDPQNGPARVKKYIKKALDKTFYDAEVASGSLKRALRFMGASFMLVITVPLLLSQLGLDPGIVNVSVPGTAGLINVNKDVLNKPLDLTLSEKKLKEIHTVATFFQEAIAAIKKAEQRH